MYDAARPHLEQALAEIEAAGLMKHECVLASPQGARLSLSPRGAVLGFASNDYLGLANHPRILAAAQETLSRFGYGLASVRFICGTQTLHKALETKVSEFLGTDDTILYSSCFEANTGLFEAILAEQDAVFSDARNHASIIDGIRMCKATRYRYPHADMVQLRNQLEQGRHHRLKVIVTDGVFSMDGAIAKLPELCDLADRFEALLVVDDSHATGLLGPGGRGTPALYSVEARVDVITSTFGKALGGASGGFTTGRRTIIELLRQRSRPYLFSNTLPPTVCGAALAALALAQGGEGEDRRRQLHANTQTLRRELSSLGLPLAPGDHPIVPVMLGSAERARHFAEALLDEGVFVVPFWYPVVPEGQARLRIQVSASHTESDLQDAIAAFGRVGARLS